MMALKTRRLEDGENEQVTIERIAPAFKGRNHLFADYWIAEGRFDGVLMRLTVLHEDRKLFLDAGYIPAEILTLNPKAVRIDVITIKDDRNRWRIGEVVSRDENAPVLSENERQAAWKADVVAFGGYTKVGESEAQFSTSGKWVNWSLDSDGRYVRLASTGERTLYVAKAVS